MFGSGQRGIIGERAQRVSDLSKCRQDGLTIEGEGSFERIN